MSGTRDDGEGAATHARIVGQDTLLGHPVDIIDYGPTIVKVVGNICTSSPAGKTCRPSKFHGSGSARLWVDQTHPFILQVHASGGPTDPHDVGYSAGTLAYHVTSVVYGQGPSNAGLHLQPAAPVARDTFPFGFTPRGEDSGPGPGVAPPRPLAYPEAAPPPLATSEGIQRLGFGPHYKIAQVSALFSTGKHGIRHSAPVLC